DVEVDAVLGAVDQVENLGFHFLEPAAVEVALDDAELDGVAVVLQRVEHLFAATVRSDIVRDYDVHVNRQKLSVVSINRAGGGPVPSRSRSRLTENDFAAPYLNPERAPLSQGEDAGPNPAGVAKHHALRRKEWKPVAGDKEVLRPSCFTGGDRA